ncbi:MAG TPA: SRPBCC domain-containing protein [Caulobacteraceae bacterium]|jgi:uncharacterized protein YndB with AHSA1/START domain|nr:SRPBCC domain-containing protein [Caulobacteraceae bacterium]
MRNFGLVGGLAAAVLAAAGGARAAVVDAQPYGFQIEESVEINAPAAKVWTALGHIGAWWSPVHTWSKNAANLSLDLKLGGCFCEVLPRGGGVRHMSVVYLAPGESAVLEGAMGPLMYSGVTSRVVWVLTEKDGKTTLTQTNYVGGYFKGGLADLAPVVDRVLGEQITRLKGYVETGKPPA